MMLPAHGPAAAGGIEATNMQRLQSAEIECYAADRLVVINGLRLVKCGDIMLMIEVKSSLAWHCAARTILSSPERRSLMSDRYPVARPIDIDHSVRDEEALAQSLLEAAMPGARLIYRDTQSHGECDFELLHSDGRPSEPVEVTTSTCEAARRIYAQIRRGPKGTGLFEPRVVSAQDWLITPNMNADMRRVRANADKYLALIEADGLTMFVFEAHAGRSEAVRRIHAEIGIDDGCVMKWKPPGRIGIAYPGGGGQLDEECVCSAVEVEAQKADNKHKLDRMSVAERHLVVVIDSSNAVVFMAMRRGLIPRRPPRLPSEITTIWVICQLDDHRWIMWRAKATGWEDLGEWEGA
jgi:hypothetical protein